MQSIQTIYLTIQHRKQQALFQSVAFVTYEKLLSEEERATLLDLVSKGSASARLVMRANVLLATDENSPRGKKSESEIAEQFHVNPQTVHTIRKTYAEHGLDAGISRKERDTPPVEPKIIALSCSTPPTGRSKWSLRLLADKAAELQYMILVQKYFCIPYAVLKLEI